MFTVIKNPLADLRDTIRQCDTRQRTAQGKSTCPDFRHACGERNRGHILRIIKGVRADRRDSRFDHDAFDSPAIILPRGRISLIVRHFARAADRQNAVAIQRPGQALSTGAGVYDLRRLHPAAQPQRQQADAQAQRDAITPSFHLVSSLISFSLRLRRNGSLSASYYNCHYRKKQRQLPKSPHTNATPRAANNRLGHSICQKASQSLRPQAQIKSNLFFPAACTSGKTLLALQVWNFHALGVEIMRAAGCKLPQTRAQRSGKRESKSLILPLELIQRSRV